MELGREGPHSAVQMSRSSSPKEPGHNLPDSKSTIAGSQELVPPPPPAPLGAPGTKLSKKERDRLFWAALRGEVPATDMVRERY